MTPHQYPVGSSLSAKIRLAYAEKEPGGNVYRVGKFRVERWSPGASWVQLHDVEQGDTAWFISDRVTPEGNP